MELNCNLKAAIGTVGSVWDKVLGQMYKNYSFFNNQTSVRLNKLIHNSDKIKMLKFVGLI